MHGFLFSKIRNKLTTHQHGFYSGRSCLTNLCCFSTCVCDAFNSKSQVDVIYTDFRKAFDQIDLNILIQKASEQFGFSNGLIAVLRSYLFDRCQFVEIEGFRSELFIPTSGVPQGSNLGPLLFNLFINDLVSSIKCGKLAYADDLKIFNQIDTVDDCVSLQASICAVSQWCIINKLDLNISKCSVVSYSRLKNTIVFDYSINGSILSRLSNVRDLGVVFDEKLSFISHIEQVVACASRMLGFILRNSKHFSNVSTIKLLYYSYVRSRLEYCSIVWSPIYSRHSNSVEGVQRRFLKYLMFREDGSYPQRGMEHSLILTRFEELPLTVRRDSQSVAFLHKLLNSKIDCPLLLKHLSFHVPRIGARQQPTFSLAFARSNILSQSPIHKMCYNFNRVSDCCDIHHDSLPTILRQLHALSGYPRIVR